MNMKKYQHAPMGRDGRFVRAVVCAVACLFRAASGSALVHGVDVSQWQYDIDWPTFVSQNQIDFAFIKYTDSSSLQDPKARQNVRGAAAEGVPFGVYHFATPFAETRNHAQDFSDNDAAEEAAWFVQRAGSFMGSGHLPPVLDIEWGQAAGRTRLTNWADEFLDTVQGLTGVRPIIYANQNWATNYLTASQLNTELWIARWTHDPNVGPSNLGSWSDYLFHQYTDSNVMPGVTGNTVDGNVFNGTLSQLQRLANPVVIPEPGLGAVAVSLIALAIRRRRLRPETS